MQPESLEQLYPELTAEERAKAQELLDRYLQLAWEIWEENQNPQSTA